MDREKQIEEMAQKLVDAFNDKRGKVSMKDLAEILHNAGYRKFEWISVEDRLPDIGYLPMNCIVAAKVGDEMVVDFAERYQYWDYKGETGSNWEIYHDWDEGQGCEITHWIPLPAPPTEKET